ncbi:MAG: hypothetical protein KGQ59_10390, partial [Bdellovibrionales bacterium]|nr:hypothetical protein [Bdellovibrionales bacterium]
MGKLKACTVGIYCLAVLAVPLSATGESGDREKQSTLLKEIVKKNPSSEQARYDYALDLYTQGRFKEARDELQSLLALNSKHRRGQALLKSVNDIEKITDQEVRQQKIVEYLLSETSAVFEDMKGMKKEFDDMFSEGFKKKLADDGVARRASLDKKYKITASISKSYKEPLEELMLASEISRFERLNSVKDAESSHLRRNEKYPRSPKAKMDYAYFLITQDRVTEAIKLIESARKQFPEDPLVQIFSDGVQAISRATSSEQKEQARRELDINTTDFQTMILD